MNQVTVTGMVLKASPIGEYDRRVVILTKERGKITAFARGARRPNSALVGVTSPFTFGEFSVYEGRTSFTLVSASVTNYFAELRMDVEGAYYGFYFLEFADYYAREYNDETQLLKLLYQTLRALTNPHLNNRLVRYIYELKVVAINGEAPQVFECICCGDRERPALFSIRSGRTTDGVALKTSTLYAMQYIISSNIEKLYTFTVKEEILEELGKVVRAYLDVYVDRHFKSLEILETIVE